MWQCVCFEELWEIIKSLAGNNTEREKHRTGAGEIFFPRKKSENIRKHICILNIPCLADGTHFTKK